MNYTNIEQSKKLLELGLNPESADMYYPMLYHKAIDGGGKNLSDIPVIKIAFGKEDIPCWSVGALLEVMPSHIFYSANINGPVYHRPMYTLVIDKVDGFSYQKEGTSLLYESDDFDNLIDAAYSIVVWLLENNYIKKVI